MTRGVLQLVADGGLRLDRARAPLPLDRPASTGQCSPVVRTGASSMAILYPVADTAEQALYSPRGVAARERDAEALAGGRVVFERRLVGPAYRSREQALDAFAGRVDDDRPERAFAPAAETRWCELKGVMPEGVRAPVPVKPTMKEGRRWPTPPAAAPGLVWRLSVAFWRVVGEEALPELPAARALRRDGGTATQLDARALRLLASQPLRPFKPQQPLDMGLFEVRLPEAPHIVVPDE